MPVYKIHHITRYEYDRPVRESINEIKIYPYQCTEQETLQQEVEITANPKLELFTDYWGNKSGAFSMLQAHRLLIIESRLLIRTTQSSQLNINFHSRFDELAKDIEGNIQLIELSEPDHIQSQPRIREIAEQALSSDSSVAAATEYFSEYIFKNFRYTKGITSIETTVDEILDQKGGVCQDFTHLMLQLLRTAGIPARYISGYICPNKNGMRGEGATHAWVEAWIPGYGWAGIDPTNNVWVTNRHIKLSVGRHFKDCSPVKGAFKGPARQKLSVFVSVGYEDGHTFEDINNVRLELQNSQLQEEELIEGFAQQQQ
ncbi:MAG: transglutaminase family protein [Chitinophagaceae bacterium]|nr:transglutaminase family protein [Chitinophagaceae bacterium]MCW5928577.1 transglutaminase family protein [Chitinophagaceae bacterium]